jgi:hypothetical protein
MLQILKEANSRLAVSLLQKFVDFMERENVFLFSLDFATGIYPESVESSLHYHCQFP